MAKRITNEQAMVEYVDDANYKRVSQEFTNVEYVDDTNYKLVSQLLIMVEYQQLAAPPSRVHGPAIQIL